LFGVAANDCLARLAESGEQHLDLADGRVLGLIEYKEGILEGAATGVGERADFEFALIVELCQLLEADEILKGFEHRHQIGF